MLDNIRIDQNIFVVDLGDFVKHDGYLHRIGTLFRILHHHRHHLSSANLRFELIDLPPVSFLALDRVLEMICQNHDLSADRVVLKMVDHHPRFQSDWCTLEISPNLCFEQTSRLLQIDLCHIDPDALLFGATYGRFTHSRLLMAHFLATHFPNDSFVIFQPGQDFVEFEMSPGGKLFQKATSWASSRTQHQDLQIQHQHNGCVSYLACLPAYHEIFCKYRIEVVIETNTHSQGWFTEKTAKCLASGKPFLLYGTPGQLQQLNKMGFRTFGEYIDESYDCVQDTEIRFDKICSTLTTIHDHPQRDKLLGDLDTIAQWNKLNYHKVINKYYHDFSN